MFRFVVIVLAFLSVAYSQVVSAQGAVNDKAYRLFLARVTTFSNGMMSFSTTGVPLATSAPIVFSAPTFTTGGAAVTTASRVAVGVGSAAVSVVGSASGSSVFSAFKALAGGPGGLALAGLMALPAIADWLSSGGYTLNNDPATKAASPFGERTETGYVYTISGNLYGVGAQFGPSPTAKAAADGLAAYVQHVYRTVYNAPAVSVYATGCGPAVCTFGGSEGASVFPSRDVGYSKVLGPDGLQVTSIPRSFDDIAPYMDKPTPPEVMQELLKAGAKIEVVPRFINGPEYVPLPTETSVTETPEKITTTEKQKGVKLEYKTATDPVTGQPTPYVQATPKETTTVKEKDKATGQEKVISVTETEGGDKPKADPQEIETCGLPGKPACIVDETGMPDQAAIDAKMDSQKAKNVYKDIDDMAKDPTTKMPVHPIINWSFALPTGCAVIPLPAFEPFIQPIDVCQFKPMFHDVMSIVWLFGGIFGAISLFMKNALSH